MAENLQELIELASAETNKAFNQALITQSIVDYPTVEERRQPGGGYVFNIAVQADEFTPWGIALKQRDEQLRGFWPTEPIMAGAVYKMSSRMASMGFKIVGADPDAPRPKTTIRAVERMLHSADRNNGWKEFVMKIAVDTYTQDNGAFIELIRNQNRPDSPVIGIAHLDSYRCTRTGDPNTPVIYRDRWGREHLLNWWNVQTIEEMPSPVEEMYGAQICAISRCLGVAQVIRDIRVYKREKISGQFAKSIHFVGGVTADNIEAGVTLAQEQAWNANLMRYIQPPIIATIDSEAKLSHVEVALASLPDGFDEETTMKWYIMTLALGFGVDYQEFAPLPGGGLGSSQQSEILHLKGQGSGPGTLIGVLEDTFNNHILPNNVLMKFEVEDARANEERANSRFLRGKDRSLRLDSGELDAKAARELAVLDGDLPIDLKEQMDKRPDPIPVRNPDPTTADQITGGLASRRTRKAFQDDDLRSEAIARMQVRGELNGKPRYTLDDIQKMRKRVQEKMSTQGFVGLSLANDRVVVALMRSIQETFMLDETEWQPVPLLHVTLAYAPDISHADLIEIAKELQQPLADVVLEFEALDVFENTEERALHIRLKRSDNLVALQQMVYDAFNRRNIALSAYSSPEKWTPHITLGYLSPNEEFIGDIPLVGDTLAYYVSVTSGEYEPVL